MAVKFNKKFEVIRKKWLEHHKKWENKWKKNIGEIIWVHLKIENSMLSTIIDLQNIHLGSKERKEVEELSFLMAAKTCFLMGYIDYQLYEEIRGFNTTRNNIVHKIFKKPEKTASLSIKKALLNGEKINEKILNAHFSLEEKKAREILGGKSEAGLPILYGKTPEENLELLKGYGGERIEEMRKEIRKEITEEENP